MNENTAISRAIETSHDLDALVLACRMDGAWRLYKDDAYLKTYLHRAIEERHEGQALWLISHGALINEQDKDGYTPLMLAVLKGMAAVVSELIDQSANLELIESSGQTALHKAVYVRNEATVKLLLDAGAETNVEDNDGLRPLDLLFEDRNIAKLLRDKNALLGRRGALQIKPAA